MGPREEIGMNLIIIAVVLVVVIGLVAGILLSFASKIFEVKEDQLFIDLRAELPGANCGGCGYAGCDDYAHALSGDKETPCNKCVVGGPDVAKKLAALLGTDAAATEKKVSFVACNGTKENAKQLYTYDGSINSCKAAKSLFGGTKACKYGCIGLGDCVEACEFDAIHVIDGVAVVGRDYCTSCGACIKVCPQNLISLKPYSGTVNVRCSNEDMGKAAMAVCKTSCIACHMCERVCEHDAVHVTEKNVAVIDNEKCVACGLCAEKCPKHAILNLAAAAKAPAEASA
jgi:electron transport complex protein RnfB